MKPDVALVQECVIPNWVQSSGWSVHWARAYPESKAALARSIARD
jgi:hypothetical protein